jgi:hypothetical protein
MRRLRALPAAGMAHGEADSCIAIKCPSPPLHSVQFICIPIKSIYRISPLDIETVIIDTKEQIRNHRMKMYIYK